MPDGESWIELDDNGNPLGKWVWDGNKGMWVFTNTTPATGSKDTDLDDDPMNILALILVILIIAGLAAGLIILLKHKRREKEKQ